MQRMFTLIVLALFIAAPLVGCRAEVDTDRTDRDSSYRKETTVKRDDDGRRTTKTETRTTRD